METRTDYNAKITFASRDLTTKEKIRFKRIMDAHKLDEETKAEPVQISVDVVVALTIHNEHAENTDYTRYIIVDKDGTVYTTGSESFWNAFSDIFDELVEAGETDNIIIKVIRVPSKNYQGRDFLSCELV